MRRPTHTAGGVVVIGREQELSAVTGFVTAQDAWPATLLLDGEPGIGKTTLWGAGLEAAAADGCRVLRAAPAETDADLPFGVLGDLIGPLVTLFGEGLPSPQRHALGVALLEESATSTIDQRAVSAASLSVLRAAADEGPVLLAIDDVPWTDPASDRALAYAVRRLDGCPVGLFLTRRASVDAPETRQLERARAEPRRISLGPLDLDDIATIVRGEPGPRVSPAAIREIHRQSGGNPFFAVELARAARRDEERPTGLALPVPRSLREDLIRGRVAELSPAAAEVLLVASATARPTVALLAAVLPDLARDDVLEEAEDASVIRITGGEVRFVHPLYRSAIYADASRAHRHRIHASIAAVIDDPEERGRHLALSVDVPDPAVADEIERAADLALARGAVAAAADLRGHAIRLTAPGDVTSLSRRLLETAEDRFQAGDASTALADAARAADLATPGPARAQALSRLGAMESLAYRDTESMVHLEAALAEADVSDDLRCVVHADLFRTLLHLGREEDAYANADEALVLGRRLTSTGPRARAYEAAAHAALLRSGGIAEELIDEAADLWGPIASVPVSDWPMMTLAADLITVGQADRAAGLLEELARSAAERGDEGARQQLLVRRAELAIRTGRWRDGLEDALAACEIADGPRAAWAARARLVWLEAALGLVEQARADAERSPDDLPVDPTSRAWAAAALGMLELSLGRPAAALAPLEDTASRIPAAGSGEPGTCWSLPDLIEALLAAGRIDEARRHVAWLEERAVALDRPWVSATAARTRGSLEAAAGDADAADVAFERATAADGGLPSYELARTLLARGTALRSAGRKRLAREALARCRDIFHDLGAVLWVQRADAELGRITGRRPSAGTLTDAERRVALLAAAGFRNREIAEQLFISVRTVEGHLSDVYGKLGIRSRTELALAPELADADQTEAH